ncbi:hypothetical protein QU814_00770 [Providencia rettgeri]|nr:MULTISPECIES: hypothetical protein [Providencia]MDK3108077.1 hypothetical protein [Providencia rettgeri]MDL9982710.1 hypothetical protein [Providencia rettgeri]MDL9986495.1 hypothetical protein [Providencia rettgeri]MDM9281740.1 hypothetical protein [Providencia rettgeri]
MMNLKFVKVDLINHRKEKTHVSAWVVGIFRTLSNYVSFPILVFNYLLNKQAKEYAKGRVRNLVMKFLILTAYDIN